MLTFSLGQCLTLLTFLECEARLPNTLSQVKKDLYFSNLFVDFIKPEVAS